MRHKIHIFRSLLSGYGIPYLICLAAILVIGLLSYFGY